MTGAASPIDAAALCADAVRTDNFGAYAAALFADPAARRALLALFAFAGELARVHDHVSQPLPGEIRLQWWSDALAGAGHGGVEGHPVAAELKLAIAAFDLPVGQLTRLIEAYRGDLYDDAIPTLAALEGYLTETTSTLIALAARICAPQTEIAPDLLHDAGLAQGLARMIGLLPHHAARGRLYLPRDLLALNAVTAEDVLAGRMTPGLRAVLAYLAGVAEQHLANARAAARSLPAAARPALLPLALSARTLERLRRADFDPFRLAPPSRLDVLWTLWRASRRRRGI
ncbi:MAG: phytoene/squalene synthase family protein [Xanthobacteraceae bacterium]